MKHNHLYPRIMIKTAHLLRIWIFLYKVSHLLNIPEHEIREVQHPHPCKMHEKSDVIGVYSRKSALTCEIFHDDSNHGGILVFKESERKKPFCFISLPRFDIRLIIVFI